MAFKISSLNVKGLNNPSKRQMAWNEASRLQRDICFQETHFDSHKPPVFQHHKFPHIFMANGPSKKRGVAIAIKDSIKFTQQEVHSDASGR